MPRIKIENHSRPFALQEFSQYLAEVKLATQFEAMIVCAYNGGPDKDPEVLELNRISHERYYEYEAAAKSIARAIRTKCKPKTKKATHYGDGAGKLVSWWNGRSTPKTDIYVGDVRISLKEAGGSQLMSAKKGEAVSTFKAAIAYMDADAPDAATKLANKLSNAMQEVVVPPTTTIGSFTTALRAGEKVDKSLEALATKFLQRDKAKKRLTTEITSFLLEHTDFRDWFVFEAATGFTKFSPEGPNGLPISNWVLKFDTSGTVHELEKMITGRGKPTTFVKKMGEKVKFRVSWKTPTSKGKKTFLSLRGDILKEEQSFDGILDEAINEWNSSFGMLSEGEALTESILGKIKAFFSSLYKKIVDAIVRVSRGGIQAITDFLGLEVDTVSVTGLEI